jgi:hypothetical protein
MSNHEHPRIGHWYENGIRTSMFKVVALDLDGNILTQHFDGEIEELEPDVWDELELIEVAPPEDWSGPFEMSKEDLDQFDEPLKKDPSALFDEEVELDEDIY